MPAVSVCLALEGDSDEPVLRRLLREERIEVTAVYGRKGKSYLDRQLPAFNAAARHSAWVVVRDLDHDADCAAALRRRLLPSPASKMCFRIAVREIEAWLLADAQGCREFFQVARQHVPTAPESLADPKRGLVRMAHLSRSRAIREDMVPAPGTTAIVGPGYVGRVMEFADGPWSPTRAARESDSLRRCIQRIRKL